MNNSNDFAELQALWVSKGANTVSTPQKPEAMSSITDRLRKFQSFQDKINRIKLIALILIITTTMPTALMASNTLYTIAGLALIVAGTAIFFGYYLRNQFKMSKLPFGKPTNEFIEAALALLTKQNAIFKSPFVLFSVALGIGANLLVWAMLENEVILERIQIHLFVSGMIAASTTIGYLIRLWRIRNEVYPIMDELVKIKESL